MALLTLDDLDMDFKNAEVNPVKFQVVMRLKTQKPTSKPVFRAEVVLPADAEPTLEVIEAFLIDRVKLDLDEINGVGVFAGDTPDPYVRHTRGRLRGLGFPLTASWKDDV